MTACIVGWAHTPFGKWDNETVESLIVRVANEALEHAGLAVEDVDEVVLGHFNGGFSAQDFTAVQSGLVRESLRHMVEDSRSIVEISLRAVNDAGKAIAATGEDKALQGRPGAERRIA